MVVAGLPFLAGCVSEPAFAVGDCVTLEQRAMDSGLVAADCAGARGTFDAQERTYKVDAVVDDLDGECAMPQGFFPVQFRHEPHGVIYCLSMMTG